MIEQFKRFSVAIFHSSIVTLCNMKRVTHNPFSQLKIVIPQTYITIDIVHTWFASAGVGVVLPEIPHDWPGARGSHVVKNNSVLVLSWPLKHLYGVLPMPTRRPVDDNCQLWAVLLSHVAKPTAEELCGFNIESGEGKEDKFNNTSHCRQNLKHTTNAKHWAQTRTKHESRNAHSLVAYL